MALERAQLYALLPLDLEHLPVYVKFLRLFRDSNWTDWTDCDHLQVLGRSQHVSEFIKGKKDSAFIEIELKGPEGEPNVVIRRDITRDNNASAWQINGII